MYGSFFFVRNPVNAVKKLFTAFNAKRCGRFAMKKVLFFSPRFNANLTLFFDETSTRERQLI